MMNSRFGADIMSLKFLFNKTYDIFRSQLIYYENIFKGISYNRKWRDFYSFIYPLKYIAQFKCVIYLNDIDELPFINTNSLRKLTFTFEKWDGLFVWIIDL